MTPYHLKQIFSSVFDLQDTSEKGFHIKLKNGYNVSVQWKEGNYCHEDGSTAEVAVWDADGKWEKLSENDDVVGWQSGDEILHIIYKYASK